MARLLNDIITAIRTTRQSKQVLTGLTGPDAVSDYAVWEDTIGYCHWLMENKMDALQLEINTAIAANAPGSEDWWHQRILEFQFDPNTPQVVQLVNFVPTYLKIDPQLRIISRVSVKTVDVNNRTIVSVKVAKSMNGVLGPLNQTEIAAVIEYTLKIRPAGVKMDVISLFPDRLYLEGQIYFDPQYPQPLVQTNVVAAVNSYCAYMSQNQFDGSVKLLTVTDYIEAVPGVTDLLITKAQGRDQATPLGNPNVVTFNRVYNTSAGYIIPEDTAGFDLLHSLTFIPDI